MSHMPVNDTSRQKYIRLHHNHAQLLHLLHPCFILLTKARDIRPLVFAPQRLRLVGSLDRAVEIYTFMIVWLAVGDVLIKSSIPYKR